MPSYSWETSGIPHKQMYLLSITYCPMEKVIATTGSYVVQGLASAHVVTHTLMKSAPDSVE
jgi:hypothetical protein